MTSIFDDTFTTFIAYIYVLSIIGIICSIMSESAILIVISLVQHVIAITLVIKVYKTL